MTCPLCLSDQSKLFHQQIDPQFGQREYYKCPQCDLVFLLPQYYFDQEREKQRYDLHQNDPKDEQYINFLNRLIEPFIKVLEKGAKGLDFGCGSGPAISLMLKRAGYEVCNYDPYYFPDKILLETKYDFITCTEALEHFYNPRKEFLLLESLLKDNGYLGVMTQFLNDEISFQTWWYKQDPTHVCFYSKKTFNWIAQWMSWEVNFPRDSVVIFKKSR